MSRTLADRLEALLHETLEPVEGLWNPLSDVDFGLDEDDEIG